MKWLLIGIFLCACEGVYLIDLTTDLEYIQAVVTRKWIGNDPNKCLYTIQPIDTLIVVKHDRFYFECKTEVKDTVLVRKDLVIN